MLPLLLLLALVEFKSFPVMMETEQFSVRVNNAEATRDRRYVLVHAFLKPHKGVQGDKLAVDWQSLFSLVNGKGEELRPSGDCGVDTGTGMHITMGSFALAARGETRILVYFNVHPDDFPLRLKLSDERLGPVIPRR